MNSECKYFFALAIAYFFLPMQGQLRINEFQASNITTVLNPGRYYLEWIEIYNGASSSVNLRGYFLTDDYNEPFKYEIPGTYIGARSYGIVFLDPKGELGYCQLKLEMDGEQLALYSPSGILLDSITFRKQFVDISYGREPGFSSQWSYFAIPTPGFQNGSDGVVEAVLADEVNFSSRGGFYSGSLDLVLSTQSGHGVIRYTTNGSWPTETSQAYLSPILISESEAIRARTFEPGKLPANVETHTYILNDQTTLPVISITTEPDDFFSGAYGIYVRGWNGIPGVCYPDPANWYRDWERPINFEYFTKEGKQEVNQLTGTRIFGGCSRERGFKSLAIYARNKYGDNRLPYKFFSSKDIEEFKTIVLRNGGQDSYRAMLRDGFMQTLLIDKMDIDYQAYEPVITYINGEYWGILNIREKINEHYAVSNFGLDSDKIDMLERNSRNVVSGSPDHYIDLIDFATSNDLSVQEHYEYVTTQMDINEFTNYWLVQNYVQNFDWPESNMKFWRPHVEGGKWRWNLYDLDFGWGTYTGDANILYHTIARDESWTELIRALMENDDFRNEFIQRMATFINTVFNPETVNPIFDSLRARIDGEINRHSDLWSDPSITNYTLHVEDIIPAFTADRPDKMRNMMIDFFSLSGMFNLTVNSNDPEKGIVQACGVTLNSNFTGSFFNDIPLRLSAIPKSGYKFSHWEGASSSSSDLISIDRSSDASVSAIFEPDVAVYNVYINEICASNDTIIVDEFEQHGDWLEIYNDNDFDVNLAGWYLSDSTGYEKKYQIPFGSSDLTTIKAKDYLLFWCDEDSPQGALHTNFKLKREGESLSLVQSIEETIHMLDSVSYPELIKEMTYGIIPGTGQWEHLMPTPSAVNILEDPTRLWINEYMSKNCGVTTDEFGESDDWIELYNPTNEAIDIGGLYFTDSLPDRLNHMVPLGSSLTVIPPHGHIILWADNQEEQGPLHLGFKLDSKNEQLGVYQAGAGFIDSLTYMHMDGEGARGRFPDGTDIFKWLSASPGEPNYILEYDNIYINEFMANNRSSHTDESGEFDDWIEIYNDNDYPVDLGGLYLTDSLESPMSYRIPLCHSDSTIIPPKGFLVLWADNQMEQGVTHLGFKLDGNGEQIGLADLNGIYIDSLSYAKVNEDQTKGRLADGSSNIQNVSGTPGTPNQVRTIEGIFINEFLASNFSVKEDEFGEYDDWIEIFNNNDYPVNVGGMFVTDSLADPFKCRIPSYEPDSTTIPAKGYLLLWADNQVEQGVLHLDFKLNAEGEEIGLFQADGIAFIDSISYTDAIMDLPAGRLEDGSDHFQYLTPSPGTSNWVRTLENIYINEFMASNKTAVKDPYGEYSDWIELYNMNDFPVDVGGIFITDSLNDRIRYRIPTYAPDTTTVPANGFLVLWADDQPNRGALHLNFKLSSGGEQIGIMQADGQNYIDSLAYSEMLPNQSFGLLEDGIGSLQLVTPSPGLPNYINPTDRLFISEIVASDNEFYSDGMGEYDDWVEIYNDNDFEIDIGGLYLTDSFELPSKFRISINYPDSTTIGPKGTLVFWADNQPGQGVNHLGFKLKGEGEELALVGADGFEIIDSVSYPDQHKNFSYSRISSLGDWRFLPPTFAMLNSIPYLSGIVINEFSASNATFTDEFGEFEDWIELFNFNAYNVDLGGLYLSDSLGDLTQYRIPSHSPELSTIPAGGYYLIFADNQKDQGINHTNFKLSRDGEQIVLTSYDEQTILDSLTYQEQDNNSSSGRLKGTQEWYSIPPTPGALNEWSDISALVINEVMGYNKTVCGDEYNEYDDWIELHNRGAEPVDIGGLYLTDSLKDQTMFRISTQYPDSTTIEPGGYLVLWADNTPDQGILHLGFKLSKTGTEIGLYDYTGVLLDSISYPFISPNISWGRVIDKPDSWTKFFHPTPLAANLSTSFEEHLQHNNRAVLYPNPVNGKAFFRINLDHPSSLRIEIIDVTGSVISQLLMDHQGAGQEIFAWGASDGEGNKLKSGIYFYRVYTGMGIFSGKFVVH